MDINIKSKWVDALRSGEYTQTNGELFVSLDDSSVLHPAGHCCLAVLGVVMGEKINDEDNSFEDDRQFRVDFPDYSYPTLHKYISPEQESECIEMNDVDENSFSEIADYIEQYF